MLLAVLIASSEHFQRFLLFKWSLLISQLAIRKIILTLMSWRDVPIEQYRISLRLWTPRTWLKFQRRLPNIAWEQSSQMTSLLWCKILDWNMKSCQYFRIMTLRPFLLIKFKLIIGKGWELRQWPMFFNMTALMLLHTKGQVALKWQNSRPAYYNKPFQ